MGHYQYTLLQGDGDYSEYYGILCDGGVMYEPCCEFSKREALLLIEAHKHGAASFEDACEWLMANRQIDLLHTAEQQEAT